MSKLIFDLDTQDGICRGSNGELENTERLLIEAMRTDTLIAGSVYFDSNDNYEKLSQTIIVEDEFFYNVPLTRHGIDMNISEMCYQVYFEKTDTDIWNEDTGQPDNLMTFLRGNDVDTVYFVGNNFEDSVLSTAVGLFKTKYNVVIVEDAICNLTKYEVDGFEDNVRYITTEKAMEELHE